MTTQEIDAQHELVLRYIVSDDPLLRQLAQNLVAELQEAKDD